MSTDYNYDEQGQFFPFFIITITALITLPVTYNVLKPSKELENTAPRIQSDFKPEHAALIEGQRKKQKRKERKLKRMILAVAGWLIIAWMSYLLVVTARTIPKIWDPYDVLGISRSADEKAIKSHYRKLSLTQHPDKAHPDPEKNITVESINDNWVEIVKAFKTLTDEEIRNNYIQYGHPDGKQSFSIGIALPQWLVQEGHGKYVLVVYGSILGILLPYLVGKWWYGTQKVTRDKVLVASAGNIFKEYIPFISDKGIIGALSSGEEFNDILKGHKADHGSSKLEQKILSQGDGLPHNSILGPRERKKLEDLDGGVRRKTLGLLWAYLGRVDLEDQTLNEEKIEVAPTAFNLNHAFTSIALAFGNVDPVLASFRTSQNLIQALAPGAPPLLQLPYFTPSVVQAIEGENARTHLAIDEFMRLPPEVRRRAVSKGLLSENELQTSLSVASQLPVLHVEKAFFKVVGERYIIPSSLVQLVIKGRIIPPGSRNIPEVNELDLEDIDPAEGDLDALHGRKKKVKTAEGEKSVKVNEEKEEQPPLAHAPYFARDHSPKWHIFLADSKSGKIAVPPFTFRTFDKPLFKEDGTPTFNVQTLKMQFGAPPQPGQYTFVMHLICDSYIGLDTKMEVTLVVDEASKAEEMSEEEEISEPEEDTLAGQMNALKSGNLTGAPTSRRKRVQTDDGSSDDSDTEGDENSESETDTDTDTDED
ncbi:hypothetical protein M501DRAFT_1006120 [Patellaria atrata CBS 101060]|uniref:J domain-containing protein n=1 Tax=Patellaria atrata CBS 101060 TaxID=1346257 RepID=A0A9P4SJR8_9PEZI|nr:hypothetical protein M501DRAFT_1006120 [Patellaria atrata CBS 101060]